MHNALNDEVNGLMPCCLGLYPQLFLLFSMANSCMCLLEKIQGVHLIKVFHLFLEKIISNVINAKISIYALQYKNLWPFQQNNKIFFH
jgi:hypothetical protein